MRATIARFEQCDSTDQWPNPDKRGNTKYWINLDFNQGLVPETGGLGVSNDGTYRGQITCKSYQPKTGEIIDVDVVPNDKGTMLRFKRIQQQGVKMAPAAAPKAAYTNGHAPSPSIATQDKPDFMEMMARGEIALEIIADCLKRQFPGTTEAERMTEARATWAIFLIEWCRDNGCQMPSMMQAGLRNYAASDEADTDGVPF